MRHFTHTDPRKPGVPTLHLVVAVHPLPVRA